MSDGSLHDPGGSIRHRLASGTTGTAIYLHGDMYRPLLTRRWTKSGQRPRRIALWIGLNPSTAGADVNDRTIGRETDWTRRWGYDGYIKCNVMDYRATKPERLRSDGVRPASAENIAVIANAARRAHTVIVGWGAIEDGLSSHADLVVRTLTEIGCTLWCLGVTRDGHPKHPLYVHGDTTPERYHHHARTTDRPTPHGPS